MPKVIATDFGIEVRKVVEVLPQTPEEAEELRRDLEERQIDLGENGYRRW